VKDVFAKLDLQAIIRNILDAPLYGFQVLEIIWEKKEGKYIPKKIEARPQEYFDIGGDGNMYFRSPGGGEAQSLPEYKFLAAVYEQSAARPYGESLLAKCFWPVTFKSGSMRFWVNYIEKFGMPFVVAQYQRGASQEEIMNLAELLSEMADESVAVTPEDITITMHDTNKANSAELFHLLIRHCNSEISKALLSQTLTTELDGGSLAAAETHYKVREEIIHSDISLVERILNDLIGMLINLNFGDIAQPIFSIIRLNSNMESIWKRDIDLLNSGKITFTKEYWIENYGFNADDFDINI
jgi:phage gp29-like protein